MAEFAKTGSPVAIRNDAARQARLHGKKDAFYTAQGAQLPRHNLESMHA